MDYIDEKNQYSEELLNISDNIIVFDLLNESKYEGNKEGS